MTKGGDLVLVLSGPSAIRHGDYASGDVFIMQAYVGLPTPPSRVL